MLDVFQLNLATLKNISMLIFFKILKIIVFVIAHLIFYF